MFPAHNALGRTWTPARDPAICSPQMSLVAVSTAPVAPCPGPTQGCLRTVVEELTQRDPLSPGCPSSPWCRLCSAVTTSCYPVKLRVSADISEHDQPLAPQCRPFARGGSGS